MFYAFYRLFSWIPLPLRVLFFGLAAVILVFTLIKIVALIKDLLPFIG